MDYSKQIAQMTLEEKASLCSGKDSWHTMNIDRLGIPSIMVSDGPHGLRKQQENAENANPNNSICSVCFPSAAGTASSFDRSLLRSLGETLGEECRAEGVSVLLGPAVNIKRSPLCGRNFEYFSEDPYLTGELASHYIQGVQSRQVGTSIKHFAANNQEKNRMTVSDTVDERTLREIYLPAFEKATKEAKPWTMMCSYNQINGVFSSENQWLLTEVLRKEWGFDGFVMSDWGAVNDRVKGVRAGLELEMPSSCGINDRKIVQAVRKGILEEAVLDEAVRRILDIVAKATQPAPAGVSFDREKDHQKAREIACSSMVLLKNNGILPLEPGKKIAFIGEFAKEPRFQGGGSSHINAYRVVGAFEAVKGIPGIQYAQGYRTDTAKTDAALLQEAVALAETVDVAVVFAGLPDNFESEGYDRAHLDLPPCQNELIAQIAQVQKNLVVVLHNGSPVAMPWLEQASAVLESYLAGEAVGEAQADLLFGSVNPSGKLAETFPVALEDTPCASYFPGGPLSVQYREGLYVGYRYYDTTKQKVLFPFGHGLSYTTFAYSDLSIQAGTPCTVSCRIKNTGTRAGAETVQLYVVPPQGKAYRPLHELKGFEKIFLEPGEEKTVQFPLDDRAFSYFDPQHHDWCTAEGDYEIQIGASSRDIRLHGTLRQPGRGPEPEEPAPSHYRSGKIQQVPDEEFAALLGHSIPPTHRSPDQLFTENSTLADAENTRWGKRILWVAKKTIRGGDEIGGSEMRLSFFKYTPIRNFISYGCGRYTPKLQKGLLMLFNGKNSLLGLWNCLLGVLGRPQKK